MAALLLPRLNLGVAVPICRRVRRRCPSFHQVTPLDGVNSDTESTVFREPPVTHFPLDRFDWAGASLDEDVIHHAAAVMAEHSRSLSRRPARSFRSPATRQHPVRETYSRGGKPTTAPQRKGWRRDPGHGAVIGSRVRAA
jgi:hypothetical protein